MNLLIELILKIFQAVFEEDGNRRKRPVSTVPNNARPSGQGAKQYPQSAQRTRERARPQYATDNTRYNPNSAASQRDNAPSRPQYAADTTRYDLHNQPDPRQGMEDFFRQLQGLDTPPPPPPPRRQQPRKNKQSRRQLEESHETLAQHIAAQEAHLVALQERAQALAGHTREHLGVTGAGPTQHSGAHFRLPGNTALEQMVMAGVVLGPCKARERNRLL